MIDIQSEITTLLLHDIRLDGGTQSRAELNQDYITELAQLLEEGHTFKEAIVVFYDGSAYWLADGFHRVHAAGHIGLDALETEIRQGTVEDAIEYSCGANATHGLRRTNEDKRRAVERLVKLPRWQERSNREVARQCGVTHTLVNSIRPNGNGFQIPINPPVETDEGVEESRLKRTTNEEKRQTVLDFIAETPGWEQMRNTDIARKCGVSESLVRAIRGEMAPKLEEITAPEPEGTPELETAKDVPAMDAEEEELEVFPSEQESEPAEEPTPTIASPEAQVNQGTLAALLSSESNEWYTPKRYVDAARELMGSITVDPASNADANRVVRAITYYDIESDGLSKDWYGYVWLNPPYGQTNGRSNQEIWSHRLLDQFEARHTKEAVLLVNANTEAKWFQRFYDNLICFTDHRIHFYNTTGEQNQPTQGNALIYLGPRRDRFIHIFSRFGTIVERARE